MILISSQAAQIRHKKLKKIKLLLKIIVKLKKKIIILRNEYQKIIVFLINKTTRNIQNISEEQRSRLKYIINGNFI